MCPRGLGTGWCRSSSVDGRSRCLIDIGDNSEQSLSKCGGIQPEGQAEVGGGGDGAGGKENFEAIEGVLSVWAPVEDRIFIGQRVQWSGNGCEVFNVPPVVPSETQKRANFCGVLGGTDLSDGG